MLGGKVFGGGRGGEPGPQPPAPAHLEAAGDVGGAHAAGGQLDDPLPLAGGEGAAVHKEPPQLVHSAGAWGEDRGQGGALQGEGMRFGGGPSPVCCGEFWWGQAAGLSSVLLACWGGGCWGDPVCGCAQGAGAPGRDRGTNPGGTSRKNHPVKGHGEEDDPGGSSGELGLHKWGSQQQGQAGGAPNIRWGPGGPRRATR